MITRDAGIFNLANSCSGGCAIQSLLVTILNGPAVSVIMSEPTRIFKSKNPLKIRSNKLLMTLGVSFDSPVQFLIDHLI